MRRLDPLGPDRFHLMLEAARIGFAVRDTHIAEPSQMRVPAAALIDKAFAKTLAAKIDRDQARAVANARRRRAATRSISPSSTATAWRCRSSTRSIRLSASASAPRRPASCSTIAAPASCSIPAIPIRSGRTSGRCTPSFRRWPCAMAAATSRSASWARTTSRWATCRSYQHARLRHGRAERDRRAARLLRRREYRGRARHAGGDHRRPEARGHDVVVAPCRGAARRRSRSTGIAAC